MPIYRWIQEQSGPACIELNAVELNEELNKAEWFLSFPGGSDSKEICLQCRRPGFNPWVGKIPGGGNGNSFQHSCLENSMDRGAWRAADHGVTKEQDPTERLTLSLHFLSSTQEGLRSTYTHLLRQGLTICLSYMVKGLQPKKLCHCYCCRCQVHP